MSFIQPLPIEDLAQFVNIMAKAYPGIDIISPEDHNRAQERLAKMFEDPDRQLYGLYRDGNLLGGMILHDFIMNFHTKTISAGGVGSIAVDLINKKQKVAKELIHYALDHYLERKMPIVMLYPFRPDFYKKMGFGYGTKINQYKFQPHSLPRMDQKNTVRFIHPEEKEEILACHNRFAKNTHGMTIRRSWEFDRYFDNGKHTIIGSEANNILAGYLIFEFIKGKHFLRNDIRINELIYENSDALNGLLTFLQTQLDQVEWIELTTFDDSFHYLLNDPRDDSSNLLPSVSHQSNTQGLGLMYRVIDVPEVIQLMADHNFGGKTCKLKIEVFDSFMTTNSGSTVIHFREGRASLEENGPHEVSISLGIGNFSSLIFGVISLSKLYNYGLVELSDPSYLEVLEKIFSYKNKPICMARF